MLHREFAINPNQIGDIKDLSLLKSRFGFDKGAVISKFPSSWIRCVRESLERTESGKTADQLTERLKALKESSVVGFSRSFVSPENWVESMQISHAEAPFHRVVDHSISKPPVFVSNLDELEDSDFEILNSALRTPHAIAEVSSLLLRGAERVTIVDPYLCTTSKGYRDSLLALMSVCEKDNVTFVLFADEKKKYDWGTRLESLDKFARSMPDNIVLKYFSLSDQGTGFIHQRSLFTSKGGIIYDRGFEVPRNLAQQETPAEISLMTRVNLESKVRNYNEFQIVEPLVLINKFESK